MDNLRLAHIVNLINQYFIDIPCVIMTLVTSCTNCIMQGLINFVA